MGILHKNKKTEEEQQREILEKIYRLGVDVGYFSHSEFGWVHREYTKLAGEAERLGIAHLVKTYYEKGKTVGVEHKKRDLAKGLGKGGIKQEEKEKTEEKAKIDSILHEERQKPSLAQKKGLTKDKIPGRPLNAKPSLSDIPPFIHRIQHTALPNVLKKITPYSRR
jgi:hypothetical protein